LTTAESEKKGSQTGRISFELSLSSQRFSFETAKKLTDIHGVDDGGRSSRETESKTRGENLGEGIESN